MPRAYETSYWWKPIIFPLIFDDIPSWHSHNHHIAMISQWFPHHIPIYRKPPYVKSLAQYPLVNEHSYWKWLIRSWFTHQKWWRSIVFCTFPIDTWSDTYNIPIVPIIFPLHPHHIPMSKAWPVERSPFLPWGNDGASDEVRRPADSEDPGGAYEGDRGAEGRPGGSYKKPWKSTKKGLIEGFLKVC